MEATPDHVPRCGVPVTKRVPGRVLRTSAHAPEAACTRAGSGTLRRSMVRTLRWLTALLLLGGLVPASAPAIVEQRAAVRRALQRERARSHLGDRQHADDVSR